MNVQLFKEFVFLYIPHSRDSFKGVYYKRITSFDQQRGFICIFILIRIGASYQASPASPKLRDRTAASVITSDRLLVSRQEHTGKYLMTHVIIKYKQRVRSTTLQILPLTYLHKF